MLEEAVRTTRGEAVPVRIDPELRLEIQGYIPQQYIDSEVQRLELYQRLATVEDMTALDTMTQELQDRFGPLPEEVQRLLAVVEIKILARQLALERLEQRRDHVSLTFHPQTSIQPDRLLQWLQSIAPGFRFQSEHVVRIPLFASTPEARLTLLKKRLQQLLPGGSM
jgi:transcription-repair coupling factor (superfamily II helicase)